ncbi:hypothetical protein OO014_16040 [Intrasporangium calvum]|uniref:ABC-2 type transport system permease protein n=1 Tax=Intrasporangium calvum TaxID=53358 RepID=A0ABT5GKP8_9MICO|nr:hypothetical protein [Intrasporangium calvum]MDC5698766.1 hypothetical protein [Intrasporangium calvum]
MVAHLVRLKLDLLRNTLRRSRAQTIGIVLGLLYGGFLVVALAVAVAALRGTLDSARALVTIGGSAGIILWTLLPLLAFGSDPTLDATRFATYAVPSRQLAIGLVLGALVGLPAIASMVLGVGVVVASSQTVWSTITALVAVPIGLLTAITVSRWISSLATGAVSSRRGRDITAIVGFVLLAVILPVSSFLGESAGDAEALVRSAAQVLAWTPLGWAWAAPGDVAAGELTLGLLRLGLAGVGLVAAMMLWDRAVRAEVQAPRGSARVRSKSAAAGDLGVLGRVPGTPAWAVGARVLTYWLRDPRYQVSLMMSPVAPLALLIPYYSSDLAWVPLLMGPLAAFLLSWSEHNATAYDSTAFWMHVGAGVPGRADRFGRLLPNVIVAVPVLAVYSIVGVWIAGRWDLLAGVVGLAVALLGAGYAVSSMMSIVLPYPVPKPGESPFQTPPGAVGMTLLAQTVSSIATVVVAAPVLVLGLLAWSGSTWAGLVALVVGIALGVAVAWFGVRLSAATYDRRAPDLLLALSE